MQITGINHVGLNAHNKHTEALDFYTKLLCMSEMERTGAAKLVNDTHLSLFVDNIDAAVSLVKSTTDDYLHIGEGKTQIIWFKNPAGNTLEFQQQPS